MCTRIGVGKCVWWREDSRKHTHAEPRRRWAEVSNNRARKANALCEEEADVI